MRFLRIPTLVLLIISSGVASCGDRPNRPTDGSVESDPAPAASLPSWNEGAPKQAIVDFVARVTDPASADYMPPAERIAVFDNDGTLWSGMPSIMLAQIWAVGLASWARRSPGLTSGTIRRQKAISSTPCLAASAQWSP